MKSRGSMMIKEAFLDNFCKNVIIVMFFLIQI